MLKILRSSKFHNSTDKIALGIGYDLMGQMHIADLVKLRHLIVVGPSGTGKSVALWCIILSIITRCPASSVKLLLFDVESSSLSLFSNVAHLYHDIVKDVDTGIVVLESLVVLMKDRLDLGEEACQLLPYIVCVIDEFDETIAGLENNKDLNRRFTAAINSLIYGGRKAKVIVILASHDPTLKNTKVNVNLIVPRIVFQTSKHQNSSTAGVVGANKLADEGAMIFKSQKGIVQLQGSLVTESEIKKIVGKVPEGGFQREHMVLRKPETEYLPPTADETTSGKTDAKTINKQLADVTIWVLGHDKTSSRAIKKQFRIDKATDAILDKVYQMGIVDDLYANQSRNVLPLYIEDILEETLGFLLSQDISLKDIEAALAKRRGE